MHIDKQAISFVVIYQPNSPQLDLTTVEDLKYGQ